MALGFSCNANVQTFPQLPVASFHANHRHALPVFSMSTSRRFTYRPAESVNFNLSQDYNKKLEVFRFLGKSSNWARDNILPLLKPADKCWQPQDFLPEPSAEDFLDQVDHLQEMNKELSDEYFVVLTGDMITEEALPTYVAAHKNTDAWGDEDTDWSVWTRGWTAEENRHGDLLSRYLYLSGRVDMKQVEKTIQYLIGSGMQFGIKYDPYSLAMYSSFQERATFLSHRNTAKLARRHGDAKLAQICGVIAADERRHEAAYSGLTKKVFELDPDGAMVAFADMLRKKISMPAHLMYDGRDENLFANFSDVAARLGVYSLADYIDIAEHVMAFWNVEKLEGLSSKGKEAQDFICQCPTKLRRLLERVDQAKAKKDPKAPIAFSWIFNRQI